MTTQTTEWLTVAEACDYLKVTRATLYRWARAGRLHLHHLGSRATRLRRADVEALLAPSSRSDHVTVVSPANFRVLDLGPDLRSVNDALREFSPGLLAQEVTVFLNQERCTDLETELASGDVLVIVRKSEEGLLSDDKSEPAEMQAWLRLGASSFRKDWDNEQDAIYDNWRELYGVQDR